MCFFNLSVCLFAGLHTYHIKTATEIDCNAGPLQTITRTTRTPAFWGYPRRLMITHTIMSYWIPSQNKTKSKLQILYYTRHTHISCLIRCANMKWIRRVLLKIQRTGFCPQTDRGRTDGVGETSIPPFQLRWSGGYKKLSNTMTHVCGLTKINFVKVKANGGHASSQLW